MAKIYGIGGYQTGKIGNIVYVKLKDENVARQYVKNITNPQTEAQTAVRAKFALLNSLAASIRPYIAIKKEGLKSGGNLFVKRNFELATFSVDTASIAPEDVQLTNSSIAMSSFTVTRNNGNLQIALTQDMSDSVDAVAYVVMQVAGNQEYIPAGSVVTSAAGDNGLFSATLTDPTGLIVVYAYGIRYNRAAGYQNFGSLNVSTADALVSLMVTSNFSNAIGALTETRGVKLGASDEGAEAPGTNAIVISAAAVKNTDGSAISDINVTGAGSYNAGASVTLTAPATQGTNPKYDFIAWRNTYNGENLSTNASYTFTAGSTNAAYVAVYSVHTGGDEMEP